MRTMTSSILTKVEGGVATLTLNRPKEMNSFDGDTARIIIDTLEAFAADVFFDDQAGHCERARQVVATGHVPHGISNERQDLPAD